MEQLTRVLAWISQGINCVLLGGHHDMTVSARAYINRDRTPWKWVYRALNAAAFWQEDHCRESFEADVVYATEVMVLWRRQNRDL